MTHIEHLVHLFPIGAAFFLNGLEQRRYREHVVLHDATVVIDKMQHLGLGATGAMNHAVNVFVVLVQYLLDDRCISAGGGENQFSCVYIYTLHFVVEMTRAAIYQFFWHGVVVALRIFLC